MKIFYYLLFLLILSLDVALMMTTCKEPVRVDAVLPKADTLYVRA